MIQQNGFGKLVFPTKVFSVLKGKKGEELVLKVWKMPNRGVIIVYGSAVIGDMKRQT